MTPTRPIFWHQGLFLQPQHFQYNDHLHTGRLVGMLQQLHPYPWGIIDIALEESALPNQYVAFSKLRAVLRDGTCIDYPGNAIVETRSFTQAELGKGKTLYIGVHRLLPDQPNVAVVDRPNDAVSEATRFVASADAVPVADRYADGPEGQLELLSYVVRLFWEDEVERAGHYELMPAARFVMDGDGAAPDKGFIPASLTLNASPALHQLARQLRDEVHARARQLEVFKPSSAMKIRDSDGSHNNFLLALTVLNRLGAQLHLLLESPTAHPWQLYGLLSQLVAELSSFSDRCNLLGEAHDGRQLLPDYEHEMPEHCLRSAIDLIRMLLTEIAAAPEMLVRLVPSGAAGGYYQASLPDGFFATRQRYHLVVMGEFDPAEFAPLISHAAKMAAPAHLEALVSHALPGIDLVYLPEAPRGIPRRGNALYFLIDPMSDAWEAMEQAEEIAMFVPDAPPGLQLEIIVSKW